MLFNQEHIHKNHLFFEKHKIESIIKARVLPLLRTCIAFLAGIGEMNYKKYLTYDLIGEVNGLVV